MSLHGVPKPGWRAFQLLHTHAGSHTLPTTVSHGPGQSTGGNQSVVGATATVNCSGSSVDDADGLAPTPGSARVFLSHWDATHDAYAHATAVVTLEVAGAEASGTSDTATVHMIVSTTAMCTREVALADAKWGLDCTGQHHERKLAVAELGQPARPDRSADRRAQDVLGNCAAPTAVDHHRRGPQADDSGDAAEHGGCRRALRAGCG